jgi:hypothetical protein
MNRRAVMFAACNLCVHRTLKARAALAGMSLSDYLIAEIRQLAARPTMTELRERVHRRERVVRKLTGP